MLDLEECCEAFRNALDKINFPRYEQLNEDFEKIMQNLENASTYRISIDARPLFDEYFNTIEFEGKQIGLAHNGWIWGGNPLDDFAAAPGRVYFMRELIAWGDVVKLRYGHSPKDNPWLWNHMEKYVQWTATLFDGFRIDNCHSTPLSVGVYMLDAARRVRPELYVVAELFTGSSDMDVLFVEKLGINALIREAMQANNASQLSELLYRVGAQIPVGSLRPAALQRRFPQLRVVGKAMPALLMDCTHDNQMPAEKRNVVDTLPSAALVQITRSAVGSVFGYDLLYPHHIDLVQDKRLYKTPDANAVGIEPIRKALNELSERAAKDGYEEFYAHQYDGILSVKRTNPETLQSIYVIGHTCFDQHWKPSSQNDNHTDIVLSFESIKTPLFGATLLPPPQPPQAGTHQQQQKSTHQQSSSNEKYLSGLPGSLKSSSSKIDSFVELKTTADPTTPKTNDSRSSTSPQVDVSESQLTVRLKHSQFAPGSVIAFETELNPVAKNAWQEFKKNLEQAPQTLAKIFENVRSLSSFNALLFKCEDEERAVANWAPYQIPGVGTLPFCGLASVYHLMVRDIFPNNNLGHALCNNLRAGNWMLDHMVDRLDKLYCSQSSNFGSMELKPICEWLRQQFELCRCLPRYLMPRSFFATVDALMSATADCLLNRRMSRFVRDGSEFVRRLSLTLIQMHGFVPDAPLLTGTKMPTMAAGMPFFARGFMRSWGRDTFISMRGLYLVTGRFDEAFELLVGFAQSVRHGLIPNLLAGGTGARYNARDATWWFLQALQDYCKMKADSLHENENSNVPEKHTRTQAEYKEIVKKVLATRIERFYPSRADWNDISFADLVQDIMQSHAFGIHFREWNAGSQIDEKMKDQGFQIDIDLDENTGILYGGNKYNCGTWMDKMGESKKAGNFGIPATPRDGAAIEITGLLKSTLRWLSEIHAMGVFPYEGVQAKSGQKLSFKDWNDRLQQNFEKHFWIPEDQTKDNDFLKQQKALIHRRGIYKDTVGSSVDWSDFQLRPNQW